MNIQVDPTSSNLASAMLNSKIRPRAVVGYGVKLFHPSPSNYVTRSPGLVFTTTGGMSNECQRYHSRLAKLLVVMKQENYASTIAWIRIRVSFAILRSALVCLRGSRSRRRTTPNIQEADLELEVSVACR